MWNVCWVIADWPFSIPFYRPFMHAAKYVRANQAEPGSVVKQSVNAIANGGSMFFYPEGTRTSTGELGRFHSGPFQVAIKAGVPIIPICIYGTFELMPRGARFLSPATINIHLLPPVYPDKSTELSTGHTAMKKDVKALMLHALEEMKKQPPISA
ncbi:hypothetical protein PSDVSF_16800 [Pseudodesulfovibrio sediminis]|uniref:Phospholipid/glycerol acyltransferase domain-containing protein n=1 Tax=Pseudodesulfovibrio sediminis TaxID=2810563 RepID=A0ABM7P6I8_9BACT|nr:hypothetical protein PSDVSF_16800 [Pseudodesulfovibrio sediminis]